MTAARFIRTAALTAASILCLAGPANAKVKVNVPVNHQWIYEGNGPCWLDVEFTSTETTGKLTLNLALVSDVSLMSQVKDTLLRAARTVKIKNGNGKVTMNLGHLKPGFYQVNLSVAGDEAEFTPKRVFNIGVNPEKIVSPQDKQPDFDEFWANNLAELAKVPIDAEFTVDSSRSNELRTTYLVKMKSLGGETMGGVLCMPNKPGKYPTYIDYLGYGANIIWYDPSKNPETVEFLVSVRDQGILKRQGHYRWIDRGLKSKEDFYYRGAFCDVVRAIDFVTSLPACDTTRLFARGESQGGAFTFVSVSLDHRIKACAPTVPFLGDFPDYWRIVKWPLWEVFEQADKEGIAREDLMKMLSYFDLKNFTDRVQCPVYMSFGLQDGTCPPHTNFAEYNMVKTDKHWYCAPLLGHEQWKEEAWYAARAEWFKPMEKR